MPRASGPDQRDQRALGDLERHTVQDRRVRLVGEVDCFEPHGPVGPVRRACARPVLKVAGDVQQREHAVHAGHRVVDVVAYLREAGDRLVDQAQVHDEHEEVGDRHEAAQREIAADRDDEDQPGAGDDLHEARWGAS